MAHQQPLFLYGQPPPATHARKDTTMINNGPGIYNGEITIHINNTWINNTDEAIAYATELLKDLDIDHTLDIDTQATQEALNETAAEASWERGAGK